MVLFATTTDGVLQGGWEYVWASYGLTWAVFAGYALSLWLRARRTR